MRIRTIVFSMMIFLLGCQQGPGVADTNGHSYPFKSLQGKWVVLNYWASWCHNCKYEIPELNRFNQSVQGKNIVLLSVNFDELPVSELSKLSHDLNIQYPLLTSNPGAHYGIDEIPGLPLTFVINPSGKVVRQLLGIQTEASLTKLMKEM